MTRPSTAERVLVIKLGALGDMVLALGPFAAIRRHYPTAFIALLTTAAYAELGERSGFFDDVFVDRRPGWRDIGGWLGLRRKLRAGHFDRIFDLQGNDRTGMYRRLLWPSAPVWFSEGKRDRRSHALDRHAATLSKAGIEGTPLPDLAFMKADVSDFRLPKRYALLAPGAALHRPAKRWPAERYGELADILAGRAITSVVLGSKADAAAARAVQAACPSAMDLTDRTSLFDIPELARGALVAVGNDTGPMHLIAAAGCPSVVLFSSASDPALSAPIGPNVTVLRRGSLAQLSAEEVAAAVDVVATASITNASSKAPALSPNSRP